MSFTLVRVGNRDRPATPEDIEDMKAMVRSVKADKNLSLVTHHAVTFEKIRTYDDCILVYKVGDDEYPATPDDIQELQTELAEAAKEDRPVVTHHAVRVEHLKL